MANSIGFFTDNGIGQVFDEDTHGNLGRTGKINGQEYQFVKFASGQFYEKGDPVVIDENAGASQAGARIDGVAGANVNAVTGDKYALACVPGGNSPVGANADVSLYTANNGGASTVFTAEMDDDFLGTAANKGVVTASVTAVAGLAAVAKNNGAFAMTDAELAEVRNPIYRYSFASGAVVTANNSPVSADIKVGDVLGYGSRYAVVTAIATASGGTTASLYLTGAGAGLVTGTVTVAEGEITINRPQTQLIFK
jgi:hypothetical protein